MKIAALTFLSCIALAGCSLAPPLSIPEIAGAPAYKSAAEPGEQTAALRWIQAPLAPRQALDPWWTGLGDPGLDALMAKLETANPQIQAADAARKQAYSAVQSAQSGLFPQIGASFSSQDSQSGKMPKIHADKAGLSLNQQIDLWGKTSGAARNKAELALAAELDAQAARLDAQAALAQAWAMLRQSLENQQIQRQIIAEDETILRLSVAKEKAGAAAPSDTEQARSALASANAALLQAQSSAQTQIHAISALVGENPADPSFALPAPSFAPKNIAVAAAAPAQTLAWRPDVQAAARRVAAANEAVGNARAAWFPDLTLQAGSNWQSAGLAGLFSSANRLWTLGPALALTLFDGGARSAALDSSRAALDQAGANYRKTALAALQSAADALSQARLAALECAQRQAASSASDKSARAAEAQWKAGTASMLNLAQARASALQTRIALADAKARLETALANLAKNFAGSLQTEPEPREAQPQSSP